jgi:hypothetical protein
MAHNYFNPALQLSPVVPEYLHAVIFSNPEIPALRLFCPWRLQVLHGFVGVAFQSHLPPQSFKQAGWLVLRRAHGASIRLSEKSPTV